MYKLFNILTFFVLISIVNITNSVAQSEGLEFEIIENSALTLADVLDAAKIRSPERDVVASRQNNTEALRGVSNSIFANRPTLSVVHQNDRLISNVGLIEWESSLSFPLWMPGQKASSKNKARMSEAETEAYEDLVALNLAGMIRDVLWELKLYKAAYGVSKNNLDMAEKLSANIERRIVAGNLPRQNALLGQQEIMKRKMEMLNAEADYIHAAREYESLTGLTEMPADIDEVLMEGLGDESFPLLKLYEAKVGYKNAEYQLMNNSLSNAPNVSLGVKRERGGLQGQYIDSVGVGISVPLGAGSQMTSKRASAAVALAEMERDRAIIIRDHKLNLHEAKHELEVCEQKLPMSKEHFEMARESLRLNQKAFELGETDLIELLRMQEQFVGASFENTNTILECKRAIARHNQVKGVLLQ